MLKSHRIRTPIFALLVATLTFTFVWVQPPAAEARGDSADEMFFYREDGLFRYYNVDTRGNVGSPLLAGDNYTSGWSAITAVDLDGDSQDEMFFYRSDGLFRYYDVRSTGQVGTPILAGDGYTSNWTSITAVDLDGDGQDEMFFYRDDGLFRFYDIRSDGAVGTPIAGGDNFTKGWTSITAVDLDGDGQDEMFFYRKDGLFRYYNVRPNGSLPNPLLAGDAYTKNWSAITSVDLDGDAQDEMFFYRDDGLFRYYEIRPTGQVGSPLAAGNSYTKGWSSITSVDLDGNAAGVIPGGRSVAPGADLDGLVASSPPGTAFVLEAGVHRGHRVMPKDGMSFYGRSGAVLDGGGVVDRAFSGGASNITIDGLIIQNYVPGASQAAIGQAGNNWVVRNNEIRSISGIGVHTGQGSGWLVKGNYIHHNGQLGLVASGRNMVIEGNRIAFNNTGGYDQRWEAGGAKFIRTSGLVVRNNHVHGNKGPGLWTDTDNIGCLYEGNLVEGNTREGIFHEVSYDCVIRNNTVRDNAKAGIWIAGSPNVEVYGNVVTNNLEAGIGASQDPRGSGAYGPHIISNLDVHHNKVTQLKVPSNSFWGWSGIQQQINDPSIFTSKGNRFHDNTWVVASGIAKPFKWADQRITWNQWRGYGNDTKGSFTYK